MTLIKGVDPGAEKWGALLSNHLLYARRPRIFLWVRAVWAGLDASVVLDPKLVPLLNRRVAALSGCVDRVRTGLVG